MKGQEIVGVENAYRIQCRLHCLSVGNTGTIDISVVMRQVIFNRRTLCPLIDTGGAEAPEPTRALGLTLGIPPLRPSIGSLVEVVQQCG